MPISYPQAKHLAISCWFGGSLTYKHLVGEPTNAIQDFWTDPSSLRVQFTSLGMSAWTSVDICVRFFKQTNMAFKLGASYKLGERSSRLGLVYKR